MIKRPHFLSFNLGIGLLTVAILSACTQTVDDPIMPGKEISIFSRVSVGDASQSAHLLFWGEEDYSLFKSGNEPTGRPFIRIDMPQEIDAYKLSDMGEGSPFNTFKAYPLDPPSKMVYATGIAPGYAIDKDFPDYKFVDLLPAAQNGLTDILASKNDGKSKGSYNEPFIKSDDYEWNAERMLHFMHLTACISFVATRSQDMEMKVGVKNVTVEIVNDGESPLAWPKSLKTYTDKSQWTYVVNKEYKFDVLKQTVPGAVIMDEGKQLAKFYVNTSGIDYGEESDQFSPFKGVTVPDYTEPYLKVNIEATLFWIGDPSQEWNVRWENLLVDWDSPTSPEQIPTGNKFLPGYKYQVTLKFNNTNVGLKATQIPWDEGGTFYYPVWEEK